MVSDTGPILHLGEAQAQDLLRHLGEVHIPEPVVEEIQRYVSGWSAQRPAWIIVDALAPPVASTAVAWQHAGLLDAGEAAAIALAQQLAAE